MRNIYFAVIAALALFCSCQKEDVKTVGEILLNKETLTLTKGDTHMLVALIIPEGATHDGLEWSSSAPDVVSVSEDGVLEALNVGSADITVKTGPVSAVCQVTVAAPEIAGISFDKGSLSLSIRMTGVLTLKVYPEDAAGDIELTWASSDEGVATVTEDGIVTAVGKGEAVITASSQVGEAVCNVMVISPKAGDYYYSDGTYSSVLDKDKTPVGVVFWEGNPCENDPALAREHPECTNGLVVALTDLKGGEKTKWSEMNSYTASTAGAWIEENTDYHSTATNAGNAGNINLRYGYNNTKGLEAFSETFPEAVVYPVEALEAYSTSVPAPEFTSGWYLPSIMELVDLCCSPKETIRKNGTYGTLGADSVNGKLALCEGAGQLPVSLWSSTEGMARAYAYNLKINMSGMVWNDTKHNTSSARAILAF